MKLTAFTSNNCHEKFFSVDIRDIKLTPDDIEDPNVHADVAKLGEYKRHQMIEWLRYRGDSLKGLATAKDCRFR